MGQRLGRPIRVGVVGASPGRGWGTAAHLPALLNLEEYAVTAVATTRPDTARRTAAEFGVPHAFAGAAELAAHPEVDVVAVVVKAPDHGEAVRAALASGKHVVCEWPLGVDVDEAEKLAAAAADAGVAHAVVLQGVHSPAAGFVADLLSEGRIGRLESITLVAAGDSLGGARIAPELAWSTGPAAGTNLLTVMAGHFLAVVEGIAGPFTEVTATLGYRRPRVEVIGTGETVPNAVPDHVAVHGPLEGGAIGAVIVHGGDAASPDGFHLKISGSEGTLTAAPARPGVYPHWADWTVAYATSAGAHGGPFTVGAHADGDTGPDGGTRRAHGGTPSVDGGTRSADGGISNGDGGGGSGRGSGAGGGQAAGSVPRGVPAGPAVNVAAFYRRIAPALAEGRPAHPSFHTAVRLHRLLAAIENAARTGVRQIIAP
ncbi:Gfo/Idh/MocA family protein [Sphaerisporangium rhizosphaerae]|uniref:Gfo/Idh/MocA family protein n=1 Tax=Sphaerisporangium rhizosphaerae TaxID=2269375 RepID=A0ABW2P9C2_9ACTN